MPVPRAYPRRQATKSDSGLRWQKRSAIRGGGGTEEEPGDERRESEAYQPGKTSRRQGPPGGGDDGGSSSSAFNPGQGNRGFGRGFGRKKIGRKRGKRGKGLTTSEQLKLLSMLHRENALLKIRESQPHITQHVQPPIIPVVSRVVSKDSKPGIQIKVNTKSQAIINEKTKKRKSTKRKAYNKLRKATIKAIKSGKSAHYKIESHKLKLLPVKKRKVAREKLKKQLRDREMKLIGQLPSGSKMALRDLDRVMKIAQKLRW